MERVVISIKRIRNSVEKDLDIPTDLKLSDLICLIVDGLHWDNFRKDCEVKYHIYIVPSHEEIDGDETMESARLYEGTLLEFEPEIILSHKKTNDPQDSFGKKTDNPKTNFEWDPIVGLDDLVNSGPGNSSFTPVTDWEDLGISNLLQSKQTMSIEGSSKNPLVGWEKFDDTMPSKANGDTPSESPQANMAVVFEGLDIQNIKERNLPANPVIGWNDLFDVNKESLQ